MTNSLAHHLRRTALESGLKPAMSLVEEKNVLNWPLTATTKYYCKKGKRHSVHPMDRLIVMLSRTKMTSSEGIDMLTRFRRTHRKDSEVVERLRLLQAMFLVIEEEKPAVRYFVNKQPSPVQDEKEAEQEQGKKSTFKKYGVISNFVADEDSRKDDQDQKQK